MSNNITSPLREPVEGNGEGQSGHKYLHLPGLIVTESTSGTRRYLLSDGLGSVRHVTDEAGQLVSTHEFDPYGNPPDDAPRTTQYGYTGEWWQADIGLLHLRARWYDPGSGTFLSVDPVESEPPYQYVRGNVVNRVDPSGYCSDPVNRSKGCPDWMSDWVFNGIDWLMNATASPAYAPGLDKQTNIDTLKRQAQDQHTGMALTPMGMAVDFSPGYGDAKGFVEVFTGEDLATGESLGYLRYLGLIGLSELRYLKSFEKIANFCEPMRVFYHGTDNISADIIRQGIDPNAGRTGLDFDPAGQGGFYVTKYQDQAEDWATKRANADYAPGDTPVVIRFEIPESEFQRLNGKVFLEPNQEWKNFVQGGRSRTLQHSYDYVEGPMVKPPYRRPRPIIWSGQMSHQLAIYTDDAVQLFDQFIQP